MLEEMKDEERKRLLGTRKEQDARTHTAGQSTLIEPVIFAIMMAKNLSDTVITNLLEYRICRVEFNLTEGNCTEPISSQIEDLLQPPTAHIIMGKSLLDALIPSFLTILIGPWSDANGRKPFIVIATTGMSLTYWCWGFLALFPDLHPYFFLLASLPASGSGGYWAVIMLCFCYISDVTEEHTRRLRMSVLTMVCYVSVIAGTAAAPQILASQHSLNPYPTIFFLSASLLLFSALYTLSWLRESVEVKLGAKTQFFSCSHVKGSLLACLQPRNGHARTMILLIMASVALSMFLTDGEAAVMYLSLREMFSWQLSDYSIFICFYNVISGVGAIGGVWIFSSLLGLPNMFVVILLLVTRVVRSLMMAVAHSGLQFYVAAALATFFSAHSPLFRTEISRMVHKQDLGDTQSAPPYRRTTTFLFSRPI